MQCMGKQWTSGMLNLVVYIVTTVCGRINHFKIWKKRCNCLTMTELHSNLKVEGNVMWV